MNSINKKLLFDNVELKRQPKQKQKLRNQETHNKSVTYHIKLIPPSCFQNSFEDTQWVCLNFNKTRTLNEHLNFINIPLKWRVYVKKLFCLMEQLPHHGSLKASAFGTYARYFSVFVHFFNKIEIAGIRELNQMTEEMLREIFLEYSKNKSNSANLNYLKAINKLYDYGPSNYNILEDGLKTNPENDFLIKGIVKKLTANSKKNVIDEEMARVLINTAIDWNNNKKQDIIDLCELSILHTKVKIQKQIKNGTDKQKSLTFVQARKTLESNKEFCDKLLRIRTNFNSDLADFLELGHQVALSGIEPYLRDFMKIKLILKRLHSFYQAFTYVICASFTGWRVSEICSITPEGLKETASGFYLDSIVLKTSKNKNEIISRPVPKIVATAILNLQEVQLKIDGIFNNKIVKKHGETNSLFKNHFGNACDLHTINDDINAIYRHINKHNFKITTHQFRRFFAHFYIRQYKGAADAVRWNFRHISKEMIFHYTNQAMNAKQLIESKKELATEIVSKIVEENEYTSIGVGNELKEFKLKAKVLTLEETSKYLSERIEKDFKDVHAMEWGYCLFQKGNTGAVCEAKTGPIEARAEPGTCGRCKFLCTGGENTAFWQQTILLHQDILSDKFVTKIMKQESEKMILIGSNILKRHKGKE